MTFVLCPGVSKGLSKSTLTYFGFLARFIVIPLVLVGGLTVYDVVYRKKPLPDPLRGFPAWLALAAHVLAALLYTTPWDNYLVATGVWWYDPQLVTGITIGWVPIEEYTFFVLQTLLVGLWLLVMARRLPPPDRPLRPELRWASASITGIAWLVSVVLLLSGWKPGTYLSIQLAWALPPIIFQLAFGADILWRYRGLVLLTLVPTTLYLGAADAVAIGAGVWTIDPAQSLEITLGGVLPLEELTFFLVTNMLITFGMTLVLVRESQARTLSRRMRPGQPARCKPGLATRSGGEDATRQNQHESDDADDQPPPYAKGIVVEHGDARMKSEELPQRRDSPNERQQRDQSAPHTLRQPGGEKG